jgi:site-specific recombinase XerD
MTGVRFSPHTLRSYICCDHLRNGRNLFYLFKILGHSSVTTTRKYLPSVGVDDLQALHDTLSPLAPKRGTMKESCDRSRPVASTALFSAFA